MRSPDFLVISHDGYLRDVLSRMRPANGHTAFEDVDAWLEGW